MDNYLISGDICGIKSMGEQNKIITTEDQNKAVTPEIMAPPKTHKSERSELKAKKMKVKRLRNRDSETKTRNLEEKRVKQRKPKKSALAEPIKQAHEQFDKLWEDFITEHIHQQEDDMSTKIKGQVRQFLYDILPTHHALLDTELAKKHNTAEKLTNSFVVLDDDLSKHKTPMFNFMTSKKSATLEECKEKLGEVLNTALAKIDDYLEALQANAESFIIAHTKQVHESLDQMFNEIEEMEKLHWGYTVTPAFKVRLYVHVFFNATKCFEKMQQLFETKHGLQAKLTDFKKRVWNTVVDMSKEATDAAVSVAEDLVADLNDVADQSGETVGMVDDLVSNFGNLSVTWRWIYKRFF